MRRFLAFALLLMGVSLANAQAPTVICTPTSGGSCIPVNASNPLPIAGSFSATLTGFLSNGLFATLTATNVTSASTALPTGATANPSVRITNNGTTVVSCTMAAGAATGVANNILVQPGSSVSRVVGTFVNIACIDQTGSVSNPVVIEGGSGLGNDSGGGGGGGGSSSITTWAGSTLGTITNYGTSPGAVLVPAMNSFVTNIPGVTQSGVWTDRIVGNAGAIFDFAGQNAGSPANALLIGGQFNTTPTTLTTGNSSPFQLDNAGNLLVNVKTTVAGAVSNASSAVATSSTNQGSVAFGYGFNGATWDQLQVDASKNLKVNVQSAVGLAQGATASGVTGSAIMGEGRSSETTAITNGQLDRLITDLVGKLIILPYANPENFLNGQITSAMTVTTSTVLTGMAAQGAGIRVYATACTVSNTHATVDTIVNLQDGSGGTVLWQLPAGHAYNGSVVSFPTPIKTTANTGLFAVNATTGANTFLSCTGYKGI